MPSYTLTYFNGRGRAEVARCLFAMAHVDYTDRRVEGEEWQKLKPDTPFGGLPLLTVDGVNICQSDAIYQYLARQFGFCGETELEAALMGMVSGCINDTMKPLFKLFSAKTEEEKTEIKEKYETVELPAFLTKLEKLLVSNNGGDGFFVGSKVSYADLQLEAIFEFAGKRDIKHDKNLCPKLEALRTRVQNIPEIKEWVAKRPVTSY